MLPLLRTTCGPSCIGQFLHNIIFWSWPGAVCHSVSKHTCLQLSWHVEDQGTHSHCCNDYTRSWVIACHYFLLPGNPGAARLLNNCKTTDSFASSGVPLSVECSTKAIYLSRLLAMLLWNSCSSCKIPCAARAPRRWCGLFRPFFCIILNNMPGPLPLLPKCGSVNLVPMESI